jgi:hypothetical protein
MYVKLDLPIAILEVEKIKIDFLADCYTWDRPERWTYLAQRRSIEMAIAVLQNFQDMQNRVESFKDEDLTIEARLKITRDYTDKLVKRYEEIYFRL